MSISLWSRIREDLGSVGPVRLFIHADLPASGKGRCSSRVNSEVFEGAVRHFYVVSSMLTSLHLTFMDCE